MTQTETAVLLGVAQRTIRDWVIEYGLEFKGVSAPRNVEVDIQEIARCAAAGMTKTATGRLLGVSEYIVGRRAQANSIKFLEKRRLRPLSSRRRVAAKPKATRRAVSKQMRVVAPSVPAKAHTMAELAQIENRAMRKSWGV
jgi:predicted transcriptional regulator